MSMQVPKAVRRYLQCRLAMGDGGRFSGRIMTPFSKKRTRNDPFPKQPLVGWPKHCSPVTAARNIDIYARSLIVIVPPRLGIRR